MPSRLCVRPACLGTEKQRGNPLFFFAGPGCRRDLIFLKMAEQTATGSVSLGRIATYTNKP